MIIFDRIWSNRIPPLLFVLISSISFFLLGYVYLHNGFPAEDALILYRYVENLAETGVIGFNYGGPRAEGATDFLWMICLSILNFIGINVAFSSLFLNTIGAAAIAIFTVRVANLYDNNKFLIYCFSYFFIICSNIALSSYLGFSTTLYVALLLWTYYFSFNKKLRPWLILYTLTILFRPEALLLLGGSYLYLLYSILLNKSYKDLFYLLVPVLVSILYFLWRYSYFDLFLPLPLYVKAYGFENEGLSNLRDYLMMLYPSMAVIVPAFFYFVYKDRYFVFDLVFRKYNTFFFSILSVLSIYCIVMITGHKSQNIYFRYEAPLLVFIFISFLYCLNRFKVKYIKESAFIVSLLIIFSSSSIYNFKNFIVNYYKIDDFTKVALQLNQDFQNNESFIFALTEAGNLPYWNKNFYVIDLAGLNTAYTALTPPNYNYLSTINFDLIELDLMNDTYFDRSAFISSRSETCGIAEFEEFLKFKKVHLNDFIETYDDAGLPSTHVALLNSIHYLEKFTDTSMFYIFYTEKRDQLYIFNKAGRYSTKLSKSLKTVCSNNFEIGYFKHK